MKTLVDFEASAAVAAQRLSALIQGPGFLRGGYKKKNDEILISDQDAALVFSTDQDVDCRKGAEYQYWTSVAEDADINSNDRTTIKISLGQEGKNKLICILDNFNCTKNVFDIGGRIGLESGILDVVVANLDHFYIDLVYFDFLSGFDKMLFDVYEHGGIPCGWKGPYPNGSLLIYNHG